MKSYTEKIEIKTNPSINMVDITNDIQSIIDKSNILDGIVNVSAIGSTAGITTIEYENGLKKDFEELMQQLIPEDREYAHNKKWHDGNGYSHLRSSLIGTSQSFQVESGRILLGTWQQIILIDFDNKKRNRIYSVKVIGL